MVNSVLFARLTSGRAARSPCGRAPEHLVAYLGFALDHPAHFRVMFGPRLNRDERYPDLERAVVASYVQLYEANGGSDAATLEEQRKANDRSYALWSMVHGYAMLLLDDRIAGLRADRRKADAKAHVRRLVTPLAQTFEA